MQPGPETSACRIQAISCMRTISPCSRVFQSWNIGTAERSENRLSRAVCHLHCEIADTIREISQNGSDERLPIGITSRAAQLWCHTCSRPPRPFIWRRSWGMVGITWTFPTWASPEISRAHEEQRCKRCCAIRLKKGSLTWNSCHRMIKEFWTRYARPRSKSTLHILCYSIWNSLLTVNISRCSSACCKFSYTLLTSAEVVFALETPFREFKSECTFLQHTDSKVSGSAYWECYRTGTS